MDNVSILTVFAHPDDEILGFGGSLAQYVSQGALVTLLCATRGEMGEISDPALATPENLAQVREGELRQSGEVLGVQEVLFLGYRDSGMAGTPDNDHPQCLHQANATEVVGRIVRAIREVRPKLVLTHDPSGGYGHPDHIAASVHTASAFNIAGDPTCYPEQLSHGLEPWTPSKLYYSVFPRRVFRWMEERLAEAGVEFPITQEQRESIGVPDEVITTVMNVEAYTDTKLAALACHRTQKDSMGPLSLLPEEVFRQLLSTEYFWLVESLTKGQEADLLEGLT